MFRTVPLPIIWSFSMYTQHGMCHKGLLTACEQNQDGTAVPSWSCSQAVWHRALLCVQWKTLDDGQRNCPKYVELYSKNKFEELVHLAGFIIRIYHDARSSERQTWFPSWSCSQAVSKPVWHITLLRVQWKTPDDGHRNCPKHVEFYSKNKFEELVHLVRFIIRTLIPSW